ncbi:hypothetical protein AB0A73_21655 [Glycomyces sp. NPDC047369]
MAPPPEPLHPYRYATMPLNGQLAVVAMWVWTAGAVCSGASATALAGNASQQLDGDGHAWLSAAVTAAAVLHWLQVWLVAHVAVRLTQGYVWARTYAIALTIAAAAFGALVWAVAIVFQAGNTGPVLAATCGGMLVQAIVFGLLVPENLRRWADRPRTPKTT